MNSTTRCGHQDHPGPRSRCRKRAQVQILYVNENRRGLDLIAPPFTMNVCWEHYLELENMARGLGAGFRILGAMIL